MYKGENLLEFDGARDDYAGFGRHLARSMLKKEERLRTCWFPQRELPEGRVMASEDEQNVFRGWNFFLPFYENFEPMFVMFLTVYNIIKELNW